MALKPCLVWCAELVHTNKRRPCHIREGAPISFPESLLPLTSGRKTRALGATISGMRQRCRLRLFQNGCFQSSHFLTTGQGEQRLGMRLKGPWKHPPSFCLDFPWDTNINQIFVIKHSAKWSGHTWGRNLGWQLGYCSNHSGSLTLSHDYTVSGRPRSRKKNLAHMLFQNGDR